MSSNLMTLDRQTGGAATLDGPLLDQLEQLYPRASSRLVADRLLELVDEFRGHHGAGAAPDRLCDERDVFVIAYPDHLRRRGERPLETLRSFVHCYLSDLVTGLHLLPFCPSSSDEGFAPIDYARVDPEFGTSDDVIALGRDLRLMVDAVMNHVSSSHEWFRGWLRRDQRFENFFIELPPDADTSRVTRSRPTPLMQRYRAHGGERRAWATFGRDQVDLNYGNPEVLVRMTETLLRYLAWGAELLRVDAIGYLWKDPNTPSVHLPKTHALIRLWRAVLDLAAPRSLLVAEVRAPYEEAREYLGDGFNEIQINGQYALPPLTLDAFASEDASVVSKWISHTAHPPAPGTALFNVLGTHDGIGLRPVRGLLSRDRVRRLAERVEAAGGLVTRVGASGEATEPFELNATFLDALRDPGSSGPDTEALRRLVTAHAIALALPGVPAIYLPSFLGARNDRQGVRRTGQPRAINRERYDAEALEYRLADGASIEHQALEGLSSLIRARRAEPAFHPQAHLRPLPAQRALCALMRTSIDGRRTVLCVHNVSRSPQRAEWPLGEEPFDGIRRLRGVVAGAGEVSVADGRLRIELPASEFVWIAGMRAR